jgi:hypothetical protein
MVFVWFYFVQGLPMNPIARLQCTSNNIEYTAGGQYLSSQHAQAATPMIKK